jgi:hypothetical protein
MNQKLSVIAIGVLPPLNGSALAGHVTGRAHTDAKPATRKMRHVSYLRPHSMSTGGSAMRAAFMALVLVLSLASPVAAGDQVPFKGSLVGTATVTPLTPPLASVLIEATGNATQLGEFTVEIPHLVNQATRIVTGTYLFTAANGDTLTASFSGQATLVGPGVLSVAETAVITGGTGRFADATGSFTTDRMFFVATGVTTGSFEGTISPLGHD